jgi:hypothetical protein
MLRVDCLNITNVSDWEVWIGLLYREEMVLYLIIICRLIGVCYIRVLMYV